VKLPTGVSTSGTMENTRAWSTASSSSANSWKYSKPMVGLAGMMNPGEAGSPPGLARLRPASQELWLLVPTRLPLSS